MHKGPMLMIALGRPVAREDADEDSLNREGDDGGPVNTLDALHRGLKDGDESCVHAAQAIARCLQEMAHCGSRDDQKGLDHWRDRCADLIEAVDEEHGAGKDDDNEQ